LRIGFPNDVAMTLDQYVAILRVRTRQHAGWSVYRFAPILMSLLLAACADHPQPQASTDPAALAAADAAKCKAEGLQPDTPPYVKCLDTLADQRAQADNGSRAIVARGLLGRSPNNLAW
jgi:hypothetical protein